MNESVIKLVDAIKSGDAISTEEAFAAAMADKLSVKIDDYRQQVAANMFNQQEEMVEEEVQLTQEEYDALPEEDKVNFVLDEGLGRFIGKVVKGTGKAIGATVGMAGKAVGATLGGVAKTAGAIRQAPSAMKAAYNQGRVASHKAIAG